MSKRFKLLVKHKLVIGVAALMCATGVFYSIYFPMHEKNDLEETMKEKAAAIAEMIASGAEAGLQFSDASAVDDTLKSLLRVSDVETAIVYDTKDARFAAYKPENAGLFDRMPDRPCTIRNRSGLVWWL